MSDRVFSGCMPALMTPCFDDGTPNFDILVEEGMSLVEAGMSAVIYCGSMGDWPLLTDAQRMEGVAALCNAGVPVIVGTGAQNTKLATAHAAHAQQSGARGLMVIPRLLSRGSSPAAQKAHFKSVLSAAPDLPAVIYNSPYYGFATRAELFFELRSEHKNLVGFKEFGGAQDLRYAAEHITSRDEDVTLMVGVDTEVFHGYVNCGATGAITGIGNALPQEVLLLTRLCARAQSGDVEARAKATELDAALQVLSSFDEGPDLVLYYKHLMVLNGKSAYRHHFNPDDCLSLSQKNYLKRQYELFKSWFAGWSKQDGVVADCM